MRRFTQLFIEMDRTKRTSEKIAAMERYFREALPSDAAWALSFLAGRRLKRLVKSAALDALIQEVAGLPGWLVSESYEAVGDFAETLALLHPNLAHTADVGEASTASRSLREVVETYMLPLLRLDSNAQRELIARAWRDLDQDQRFVFNKLITGNFRVGAADTMVVKGLAAAAGVSPALMAHRFSGTWKPTPESFEALMAPASAAMTASPEQPYPFMLGYALDILPEQLGEPGEWVVEHKYDGIRAQLIHRPSAGVVIWSRGEERINGAFPELVQEATALPNSLVMDGELLAWENGRPLPFRLLQRRLNRRGVEPTLFPEVPIRYLAFDLLELDGEDWRNRPLQERRTGLAEIVQSAQSEVIGVSPRLMIESWDQLEEHRSSARSCGVEGLMLKRIDGKYGVGRRKGDWWKWKVQPLLVDAVLIHAQGGSGRRSGLFTDYTFGLWTAEGSERQLVPVAKAYSGLTDAEIRQVDRFIRTHTIARHGPVRVVEPRLVFELAFEGVAESDRHKAGLALRFPRMNRWRTDKTATEADSLQTLQFMLRQSIQPGKLE